MSDKKKKEEQMKRGKDREWLPTRRQRRTGEEEGGKEGGAKEVGVSSGA